MALLSLAGCSSSPPDFLVDIYGWPEYVPKELVLDQAACHQAQFEYTSIDFAMTTDPRDSEALSVLILDQVFELPDVSFQDFIPSILRDVESVAPTTIRDLDAFTVDFESPDTGATWPGVIWQEGRLTIAVVGPQLSAREVEKVAESLKPATKAEFENCD